MLLPLPLGNTAICMPPYGVTPTMRRFVFFNDQRFVDFYAKARLFWQFHISIHKGKVLTIQHIIQHIASFVIVNGHALFLNDGIVASGIQLNAGGQRYRPEGAMRGEGDIMGFCHGSDFLTLCNATRMRKIRLDNVHPAYRQQLFKIPAREEAFACSNRDIAGSSNLRKCLPVIAQDRLLQEHRFKFFQMEATRSSTASSLS